MRNTYCWLIASFTGTGARSAVEHNPEIMHVSWPLKRDWEIYLSLRVIGVLDLGELGPIFGM